MSSTVAVVSGGNVMQRYRAKPGGTAKGAVIVLQEAFGITDYIEDVCDRLAAAGYRAVAPHLFHRAGDPVKEDPSIPADQVESLRTEAKNAGVPSEVVQYPGAGHAFHTDGRDAYHATSAEDAWKRTLDWLGAHLAKG
jgi:dienelactone hydrolase